MCRSKTSSRWWMPRARDDSSGCVNRTRPRRRPRPRISLLNDRGRGRVRGRFIDAAPSPLRETGSNPTCNECTALRHLRRAARSLPRRRKSSPNQIIGHKSSSCCALWQDCRPLFSRTAAAGPMAQDLLFRFVENAVRQLAAVAARPCFEWVLQCAPSEEMTWRHPNRRWSLRAGMGGPFFSARAERRSSAGKDRPLLFILEVALYVVRSVFILLLAPDSGNP